MLKLAFLLIGPAAFRSQWYSLAAMGAAVMVLGLLLATGLWDGATALTAVAIGLVFAGHGLAGLLGAMAGGADRRLLLVKGVLSTVAGALMLTSTFQSGWALVLLLAPALIFDGAISLITTVLQRFPGWWLSALYGVVEVVLAVMIVMEWPFPGYRNISLCLGLFVGLSGWVLLKLGFLLRTLEDEVAILMLPIFSGRGWYDNAPVLIGDCPSRRDDEPPLTIRVWTPAGSIDAPEWRPLFGRYIAAADKSGVISTGHSALDMGPDLYISHYPAVEVEHSNQSFMKTMNSAKENDVEGRFLTSYAEEVASWCEADASVEFKNFSPRRLRVFWAGYRQENRYNLTNRNCSVLVAAALDAALEGALATRFPWLRLAGLLLNPDLWVASMLRSRASSMTWTPGLLLDYARTVARIVERREVSWVGRLRGFLARLRRADTSLGSIT